MRINVPENAGQQTVHRVLAHDKDDGVNGKIFYTIDGRSDGLPWSLTKA
jgi:hypothetical protein